MLEKFGFVSKLNMNDVIVAFISIKKVDQPNADILCKILLFWGTAAFLFFCCYRVIHI